MNRYLELARKFAIEHKYEKPLTFKHCAMAVSGGRVLSVGFNFLHNKDLRFDAKLARKAGRFQSGNHAEIASCLLVRRAHLLEGAKIYVVRIGANGTLANSRPCSLCQKAVEFFGISRVIYSINEKEYGVYCPGHKTTRLVT